MYVGTYIGAGVVTLILVLLLAPVVPELFRKIVARERKHPIPPVRENDDFSSGWYFLCGIEHARRDYRMLSGSLDPRVYDIATVKRLRELLEAKPKLKVRILVGPQILCTKKSGDNGIWELFTSKQFGDRLQIRVISGYPEEHFRIADEDFLFLEPKHAKFSKERTWVSYFPSYTNAAIYAPHFDHAWSKASPDKLPEFVLVNSAHDNPDSILRS